MTFDGLGTDVGHVSDHLGHSIGVVLTVFSVLQGGLKVGIGVHW